ncbi:MAG: type I-U CRISPR-associated protein Cas7 [Planctomycetaceae bacterium]|nr:type I-U CRISPR-associated protein Cas7 [Planctomycetaceae bacterium]
MNFDALNKAPRILIEAQLKPVAGSRIQPTGFPDLGPALYNDPNDIPTLLVESAQSMANRLESVCWDEATNDITAELKGLPYINVKLTGLGDGSDTTCSLLEFHRLNSPYIMSGVTSDGRAFADVLKPELGMVAVAAASKKGAKKPTDDKAVAEGATDAEPDDVAGVVNLRKLATVCFKYDPNSLVHGVFLEKIAGRLRHPRALSAFVEASGVGRADSGGVKFDRALPKPSVAGVDAKGGYGNVPFHRTEFTAKSITAFFSLDLGQIRGYGLGPDATQLLIALSLWKVRRFLDSSMRLRTACELELIDGEKSIVAKRPESFQLPSVDELTTAVGSAMKKCKSLFATPTVTELTWNN